MVAQACADHVGRRVVARSLARLLACSHSGLFDMLIAHPHVLPYLEAFVQEPQLVNTWSLSKSEGAGNEKGGWHGGLEPRHYAVDVSGQIRTQMLNVVWSLTDNGPGDGDQSDAISCFN